MHFYAMIWIKATSMDDAISVQNNMLKSRWVSQTLAWASISTLDFKTPAHGEAYNVAWLQM